MSRLRRRAASELALLPGGWAIVALTGCAPPPSALLDAGASEAQPGLRDVSTTFDAYAAPDALEFAVPDATRCLSAEAPDATPGDTCLARGFRAACAFVCGFGGDAGYVYSCADREIPAAVGACVLVDGGGLTEYATTSLCCASEACVRYAPADPSCNTGDTTGETAWSCPTGVTLQGGVSSAVGPLPDTVTWCR